MKIIQDKEAPFMYHLKDENGDDIAGSFNKLFLYEIVIYKNCNSYEDDLYIIDGERWEIIGIPADDSLGEDMFYYVYKNQKTVSPPMDYEDALLFIIKEKGFLE